MSSKRALYKPAPEAGVKASGKHGARKPLIQGRLVNSPVLPDSMTVYASPSAHSHGHTPGPGISRDATITSIAHDSSTMEGPWTPPRKVMASYSPANRSTSTFEHSPRRTPHSSLSSNVSSGIVTWSPPKPSPSQALDLSDAEHEVNVRSTKTPMRVDRSKDHSVLVVDASGGRLDPTATEVMVQTGMVQSPAKVICHAPSAIEGHLRDTGSVEAAANITVDQVPSMSITRNEFNNPSGDNQPQTDVDPSNVVSMGTSSAKKLAFEDTEGSITSDTTEDLGDSLALKDALVTSGKGHSTDRMRPDKDENVTLSKEKKKKKQGRGGHIVPSRYMQSASKTTATPSTVRSKSSTRTTYKSSKPSDDKIKKVSQKPPLQSSSVKPTRHKPKKLAHQQFSYTPMDRGAMGKELFTSTPAFLDGSFFPEHRPIDSSALASVSNISAIVPDQSVLREDPATALESRFDDTRECISVLKKGPTVNTLHSKEITQFDLDKMYARYMQWVFLESKMQKLKQEEEKEAMSQLYLLHEENESILTKKTELELKLSRLKHANLLDQQLDVQKVGLGPVAANLQQFQSQYSTLAHALDTTRHQIGTVGVFLPQNEEVYQDDLLTALSESELILRNISSTLQDKTSKTATFTKALQALDKAVEAEDKELHRCQQLLAKTSINTTYETSLRLQHIEGRMAE